MPCKHEQTKVVSSIENEDDVRQTVCAGEGCGFIVKREVLVRREDGEEFWRPQRVAAENQPAGFAFVGKDGATVAPEENIISAQEMALLAVSTREKTVGKASRELVKTIIDRCVEHVLEGECNYQVAPEDDVPGEIIALAVKELKAQGYKVKQRPVPGEGVWIEIKWSTRAPRKKGAKKGKEIEIKIGREKTADTAAAKQQKMAAKQRKTTMKARSDSQT